MAVYCGACAKERDLPRSAVRVASEPCQYCGGFESQTIRKHVGRPGVNRRAVQVTEQMKNFDYPDKLINSMPGSFEQQAHREYEGFEVAE
jgi:hypothetical protein